MANSIGFAPNAGQIIVGAFARIQVRRTEITATHMADARTEANLLQASWGNQGPNLWTVDQQQIALVQSQVIYQLPPDTIDVLEIYLSQVDGIGGDAGPDAGDDASGGGSQAISFDRVMTSLGRDEYVSMPNKTSQSPPTSFWFQKGLYPSLHLYPCPDQSYTLYVWRERQIQAADFANAGMLEMPYLWLDAFMAGLAHRLARIYAQPLEVARKADAAEAWAIAAEQDIERVPLYLSPDVSSYYR